MTDPEVQVRVQRAETLVLQRMEFGKGKDIAEALGVSPSTLSEIKNKDLLPVLKLLATIGLKVVPADNVCLSRASYDANAEIIKRVMDKAPQLYWGTEE